MAKKKKMEEDMVDEQQSGKVPNKGDDVEIDASDKENVSDGNKSDTKNAEQLEKEKKTKLSEEEGEEECEDKNESVENPFLDAMYNDNLSDIKTACEKSIADKVYTRIQEKKSEILDRAINR